MIGIPWHRTISITLLAYYFTFGCHASSSTTTRTISTTSTPILTVGSVNADTFLTVSRLPKSGENLTTLQPPKVDVPGGKGCNQAIAVRKMNRGSCFWGQFGCDGSGTTLRQTLETHDVDISPSRTSTTHLSGRGHVFVEQSTGTVSAVVSGGSNMDGWEEQDDENGDWSSESMIRSVLEDKRCRHILLQREIPEWVNLRISKTAKLYDPSIVILQDVGGEDRPISREMLQLCDYLMPNETELRRLVRSLENSDTDTADDTNIDNADSIEHIVSLARSLQSHGAQNILVTLGDKGSILVPHDSSQQVIHQPACTPLPSPMLDETGAGDCFRAAFAVALSENDKSITRCLQMASAAGALAVTQYGAVPSIPTRDQVETLCQLSYADTVSTQQHTLRGGASDNSNDNDESFPYLFGSRLNSMKDQPQLTPHFPQNITGWVARQGTVSGLNLVDFNYPQHFLHWSVQDAKQALQDAGLKAGAVCLRYPHQTFQQGAMTHFDPATRQLAIDLTKQAAETALTLGCNEVVIWSAYDGYDYPFQVDHVDKKNQIVHAFREVCDAYPKVKFSLEYKPTDENTRFFAIPSTGAAMMLVEEIDRPNMGLTLDVGHMLMAGENPGQSIALVQERNKKLFGIQLNDGYTRLAAEDGLMFGSVHPTMALEIMYYLRKTQFDGHLYFDTFPQRTDPVRECEYNIEKVKEYYRAAVKMDELLQTNNVMDTHDALGALQLMDQAMAYARERTRVL